MSEINVTFDGASHSVAEGTKVTQLVESHYPEKSKVGPNAIVVARINGELKDLWSDVHDGDVVETIAIDSPDGLMVLRHSTAHVLAQAVQETFSQTRLGIGPPITDGFYYDFDPQSPFTQIGRAHV